MSISLIFSLLCELLIVVFTGFYLYTPRFHNKLVNGFIFAGILGFAFLASFYRQPKYFVIATLMCFLALLLLLYKMPLFSGILTACVLLLFTVIGDFVSMLIMSLSLQSQYFYVYVPLQNFISLLISDTVFFLLSVLYVKFQKKISFVQPIKYSWLILVVLVPTVFLLFSIPNYFFMVENDKVVMFTILSLMLSNIITIFIFFKFQVSQSIKLKLKEEEKKKEELKKQILLYKQYYQNHFNLLHSLLHRYSDMKKNIMNQQYDVLEEALEDLSTSVFHEFNSMYSQSYTLNMLITDNLQTLKDSNIQINTKLKCIELPFEEATDEYNLFKELLNIGICSCQSFPKSVIYILSEDHYSQIVFQFIYPAMADETERIVGNKVLEKIIHNNNIHSAYRYNDKSQEMRIALIFQTKTNERIEQYDFE